MRLEITYNAVDYSELLSLAVIKEHLKLFWDETDEDALIGTYANAALLYCANITGHMLKTSEDVSTAIVTLDRGEKKAWLRGVTGATIDTVQYLDSDFVYQDFTDYKTIDSIYPMQFFVSQYPDDINMDVDTSLIKIGLNGGTLISSLPSQYKQAVLLLVGHYYANREAEYIGGVTNEVKEGVHRLLQSVRKY
jgi:hypothetical protein